MSIIVPKKSVKEICDLIDQIIEDKDSKHDYQYTYLSLQSSLNKITYDEILLICETVVKIAKTKNRIIRFLEKDFWFFISKIPVHIFSSYGFDSDEDEDLEPNFIYENSDKKKLSRLMGLSVEILELKDDNSNGSNIRRAGSLNIIRELINYYTISIAKKLFSNSITSTNKNEQYVALEGLVNYYNIIDEDIDDILIKNLNQIFKKTNDRTVASTCLQIQINAGVFDELSAVFKIDDWKRKHVNFL